MPGGVEGVDPGLPAPPPVCWGGVPPGVHPAPDPPPDGGGGGGGPAPPDPLAPPEPLPPPDGLPP